ncbi:MAG TPA: sigma-70 family RNA polymerase sigma factor [Lacunisphaera sp.]|nr:sigma-70 family RNA polymerase sigma factor [Lacunisphaera sp.]
MNLSPKNSCSVPAPGGVYGATMDEDDITLLRRYTREDRQEAFAELVRRNMAVVYSAALRRLGGDAHLARDVSQEVFISLARHAHRLARREVLAGWLHAATRNAAANRVRGEIRRRVREQEAQAMHATLRDPESETNWSELAPVLDEAMDGLPEGDRSAILQRFFHHCSFAQMGRALRISEDAARMRVDRALGRLHDRLIRRGIRSSAAALGMAMTHHAVSAAPVGLADAAAAAAMATPLTPGHRLAEFLASYGRGEAGLGLAAVALFAGALFIALATAHAKAESEAARLEQGRAVHAVEQQGRSRWWQRSAGGAGVSLASASAPTTPPSAAPVTRMGGGRRTEIAVTHESFYRTLHLDAAAIERFESLCAMASTDTAMWVFDHTEVSAAPVLSAAELERELRMLLGDQGYAHYETFRRTVPARSAVMQIAGELYLSEPLRPEQAERLTALFIAAQGRSGGLDRGQFDWDGLHRAAAEWLTPGQLRALTALGHRAAYQQALQRNGRSAVASP